MKRNKWLLSLSIGLLCCGSAYAQTTVKGKITSEGGEPLIGATVAVKNSTDGTVTDIDGNYSLKTKKTLTQKDLLVFSYVGYKTLQKNYAGNTMNVKLAEESQQLNDVVVTALGIKKKKKERESKDIKIVPYEPCYQSAFRTLNEEWITAYFRMEEADYKALDHPKEYILEKGGAILVALYKDEPVGVCALCKMDHPLYDYELAKLAVSPKVQGKGIGVLLCEAVVNKAKELGGKRIFIESNTRLKPAIHIYHKLGFKELPEYHTTYERGDIQMELMIEE